MFRSLARSSAVVATTVALSLVGMSIAYAGDDLVSDGDGAVPVSASALAFGTVCRGTAQSRTVAFAIARHGGGQIFANSATVTISMVTAPSGVTGGSFGTIALTSTWSGVANNTLSAATTGVVTIDTSTVRTYSGTVTFRSSGSQSGGGTLTRDDNVTLTGSVVACDSTAPVLTLPAPITAEATSASGAVVSYTVSALDAVDGARPVTCSKASGTTFAIGTTTVNCSATDLSANTANGSFTVTVADTVAPVLSLPANQTIEATGPTGAVATYTATASDVVDGVRPVTCAPLSGTTFALGTTTVNCSSTDLHGNTRNGSFTVTVRDTTAPTLTLPAGAVTAEATGPSGAAVTYVTSASDTVDTSVPVVCDKASGATFPLGATVVHCTATDDSTNAASGQFTVTVGDTTKPTVSLSGPVTVEATGPGGAPVTYTASASDTVSGALTPSCAPASGSTFGLGTTTITCSATDGAGNTDSATHDVAVVDTTIPSLDVPGDVTTEATSATGALVPYTVSATDLVDGAVLVECDHPAGAFAVGVTTVNCSATDAHDNTAYGSFLVTVTDTTAPALSLPADITAGATSAAGAGVTFTATAVDVVAGSVPVTCAPESGAVFPLGTTPVACSASDGNGNTAHGGFDVTVEDTTAPVLHAPPGIVAEATSAAGAVVTFAATADDDVDPSVDVVCTPDSGTTFALGTTTVSCTATDDAGNTDDDTFDVTVQDTIAPAIGVPDDVVAEATGAGGAAVSYLASATDAVSDVTPDCSPASGTTFTLGAHTVHCTATDDAGNASEASFGVTVVDTTAPVFTPPANQTVEATGSSGAVATFTATGEDVVDGTVDAVCTPASGATFPLGETTVDCTVTDVHGNDSGGSFTVTVVDTTAPVLTLPDNISEEAGGPAGNAVTYTATAHDVVSGDRPVTCDPASGATFGIATTTVDCAASDTAGNTAHGSFTVTVHDETAPVVTVPDNAVIEATGPGGAAHSYTATAHDTVDGDVAPSCDPASGATFPLGVTTVACEATDDAGNTGTGGFTVQVVDTTAPVVTVPADRTVEATGPSGATTTFASSATDAVSGTPATTCDTPSGATFPLGTTTVTCSATDGAGNTGSASFHVSVSDTTAPALTVPSSVTAEATGPAGAAVTYATSATDAVSGSVTPSCNPVSGATFALGTTTVVCTATDGAGNATGKSFAVNVVDTHAPSLTVPASFGVAAGNASGALVTYATSATDAVSGSVPVVCSPASGAAFPIGGTLVGCSATDGAGNAVSKSFTVSVGYLFGGFLQPVNNTAHAGVSESRFKLGSTVPLKFQLGTLGSASVQQAGSPAFAKTYRGGSCDTATVAETIPDTSSTTGTVYRWETSQYIYNFSTKGLAAGEYRVYALTSDGAAHYVDLCLQK